MSHSFLRAAFRFGLLLFVAAVGQPRLFPEKLSESAAGPEKTVSRPPAPAARGTVTWWANVHSGPSTKYRLLAHAPQSAPLALLGKSLGWYQVRFTDGVTGWLPWRSVSTGEAEHVRPVAAPPLLKGGRPAQTPVQPLSNSSFARGRLIESMALRTGPSKKYGALKSSPGGSSCEVLGKALGWYRVRLNKGQTGWVPWQNVDLVGDRPVSYIAYPPLPTEAVLPPAKETTPTGVDRRFVLADHASLRTGPGTSYGRVASMKRDLPVEVLEQREGWYHVQLEDGHDGWVAAWLLTKTPPAVTVAQATAPSPHPFVSVAMRYRGVPYRRGGTTSRGFDCSGLVQRVLLTNGVPAPRTAAELYHVGTPVSKQELRPGDLVFFRNTYKRGISHVGIFIGNGQFIHASSSRRGVTVTSLSSSYYVRKWAGARRLR